MINEEVLSEKLKYLIQMNARSNQFEIINIYIEFEFSDVYHTKIINYDIDVKFDYMGGIDFSMDDFLVDVGRISQKMNEILSEWVITQDGKIARGANSNCYSVETLVFNIEYKADETHIFDLGYKFQYEEEK